MCNLYTKSGNLINFMRILIILAFTKISPIQTISFRMNIKMDNRSLLNQPNFSKNEIISSRLNPSNILQASNATIYNNEMNHMILTNNQLEFASIGNKLII